MRLLLMLLVLSSPQSRADKVSSVQSALGKLIRYGIGYGASNIDNIEPSAVTDFDKPRSFWQETDILLPVSLHLAVRETWDDSAQVDFYGNGTQTGEIYFTAVNLGAKFTLPIWRIQPWLGGGVTGGFIAVSDPSNRNTKDWKVAFDKITKAVRGAYYQAGLDLMITNSIGLRVGWFAEKIRTDRFSNLSDQALEFNHSMLQIGLCGTLK